jgi:adenylate cyclase
MARIFLSYAREDAAKAGALATALERAGHQVWWDRHVGGGARFAAEIAAALNDAEAVIVLWSRHSVTSTWVQDEAAEGRDRARLIPILLDASRPPLGFRQFQAVDLSGWSGRGRVPRLAAVEAAIATVLKGGTLAGPSEPAPHRRRLLQSWHARAAAAAVMLALLVGIWLAGSGRLSAAPPTTLAVMPFADFSPQRDKAYFAEGVAEEIRTLLSGVKDVRVTGRTSTEMLGPTADFKQAREKLGATHLLEGSLRVDGQKMRLHVRLVRTKDGIQVWADEFDRELTDIFAVQDEIGASVARRLRGALWGSPLDQRTTRTAIQAFDLVLAAQGKWDQKEPRRSQYELALEAERLLKRAIEIDPGYAPAWTALSRNMFLIINDHPEGAWGPTWHRNRELMLRYARRAVAVDPEDADAHAWLGFVEGNKEDPEVALARIERAIELNPGDGRVWGLASLIFAEMCENRRALQALRRVAAIEPLRLDLQSGLMWGLYAFGHNAEADALRRKLSRDPELAEEIAFTAAMQGGDVSTVLSRIMDQRGVGSFENIRAAHLHYALGATDRAVALLPSDYKHSLGPFWKHDYRRAAAAAGWLRHGYWNSARGFALTRALDRSRRHRELLQLLDQRFGSIREMDRRLRCALPAVAAPVVSALRAEGRSGEAEQLIRFAERRFRQSREEHFGDEDVPAGYVELLLVAGRPEAALGALEQALRPPGLGRGRPAFYRLDLTDPIYDPIRSHPRFKAVERRIAAWRAKELRDLAAAGVKA